MRVGSLRGSVGGLLGSILVQELQASTVFAWRASQFRRYAQKKPKRVVRGPVEWVKADREKWQPDLTLDIILKKDEEWSNVLIMKDVLANTPGMQLPLKSMRIHRWEIGLIGQRPSWWLRRYPKIFQLNEKDSPAAWFEFTAEARERVAMEKQFWIENEGLVVDKLRKILMMSPARQISLDVLGHLKKAIGLPEDFRSNLVHKYPQYFRVAEGRELYLKLTEWDPELAVTSFEKIVESNATVIHNPKDQRPNDWLHWLSFDKKWDLSKKEVFDTVKFHKAPFVSPYREDPKDLEPRSLEAEKHAVAVLHELLSLTCLKRIMLGRLAHFKPLFHFNKSIRSVCVQHPELFYVSTKRYVETAFLRGAYRNSKLIVEDPFLSIQAWVAAFMEEGKQRGKREDDQMKAMTDPEGTDPEGSGKVLVTEEENRNGDSEPQENILVWGS